MLGAGGPALGVFLLGSLMWNVDLSPGPGVGRAHPTSFLSIFVRETRFCQGRLSNGESE